MSTSTSDFIFVHIPCDGSIREISASKGGGLENDECQKYAKRYFADGTDGQARLQAVMENMQQEGKSVGDIDPQLLTSLQTMGASVDICSLSLPTAANGYIGVSLYCDGNAVAKGAPINTRATDLARCCGNPALIVYGDAFVGRYYDYEEEEWSRISIHESELQSDAGWIVTSAKVFST